MNPKKIRSGLTAKLGSFRRHGRRSTRRKAATSNSSRPTVSHPIPIQPDVDSTDGTIGDSPSSASVSTLSTTASTSTETPQSQQEDALKVEGKTSSDFRRSSRRAIISNYHQDTVSLDSASVSSQSELSEPALTASGERCYLHADSRQDHLLFNGGGGEVIPLAMEEESSFEATLRSPQSTESAASVGTGSSNPPIHVPNDDYDHLVDDYDHLDDEGSPPPSLSSLPAPNGHTPVRYHNKRMGSVDFEKVPEAEGGASKLNITSQDLWKNSVIQVESDSDSEASRDTAPTKVKADITDDEGPPQVSGISTRPSAGHLYSNIDTLGSKDGERLQPDGSNYYNFSVLLSQMQYANVFIPGPGGNAYGGSSAPVKRARPRSKSSSRHSPKKSVPLPRKASTSFGLNGHSTNDDGAISEKDLFVESLPANFKPQPPPKPSSLAGVSPKVSVSEQMYYRFVCTNA